MLPKLVNIYPYISTMQGMIFETRFHAFFNIDKKYQIIALTTWRVVVKILGFKSHFIIQIFHITVTLFLNY